MQQVQSLITQHLDIWTGAIKKKAATGRGSNSKIELTGIKKLRELILELAVRGKLVPQDPNDEPACVLLEKIAAEKARLVAEGKIKKAKALPSVSNEEKPFDLPKGWKWSRIAEIAQLNPKNEVTDETEVSFVPMPLITTSYDGAHKDEVRQWREIKKGYTHFADGDIAIAKITPCFENSKAAIFSNLKNGIGAGTTELHVARLHGALVNPRYVILYLKAPLFLLKGENKMTGSAGQKRLPRDFFATNPLPIPPLVEQHRIVEKVQELMALCDKLEQKTEGDIEAHQTLVQVLLDTLSNSLNAEEFAENWKRISAHFHTLFVTEGSVDQLQQTILQLAVMGKLVPQDPNDEPASVLLKKIQAEKEKLIAEKKIKKQKPLPEITREEIKFQSPKSWNVVRLDELAMHSEAGWSPKCEDVPRDGENWGVLKVSAVTWGEFRPNENKALPLHLSAKSELEVQKNDFLISRANTAELVARSVVVKDDSGVKLMMSDKIIRFIFSAHVFPDYLNCFNNSKWARDYYMEVAGGTSSSMKNVSRKQIQMLVVPLPPIAEQKRIVTKVDELMTLCDQLKSSLQQSQNTQVHLAESLVKQGLS